MNYNDRISLSTSRAEPWSTFFQEPGLRTDHELKVGFAISAEKGAESDDDDAILAAKLAEKVFERKWTGECFARCGSHPEDGNAIGQSGGLLRTARTYKEQAQDV
jgi:hypothetical protein